MANKTQESIVTLKVLFEVNCKFVFQPEKRPQPATRRSLTGADQVEEGVDREGVVVHKPIDGHVFVAGVNLNVHQAGALNTDHVINAQIEELLFVGVDVDTICCVS